MMKETIDKLKNIIMDFGCERLILVFLYLVISWLGATIVSCITLAPYSDRAIVGLSGVAVGAIIAVGNELYDSITTDYFNDEDLAACFIGIALFYVVYCV